MRKKLRALYGWRYESLDEKIRYMLSLSLIERYEQNIGFVEFMRTISRDRGYSDARKTFKTVQVIRKK